MGSLPSHPMSTGAPTEPSPGPDAASALVVERLHKSFGGIRAVWDVSFSVPFGRTVGLIGPNGSGKTTLLHLIAGYHRPDAGRIIYEGEDIAGISADQIARRGVVRTWQDPRIIPTLTVRENVGVGLLASGKAARRLHEADPDGLLEEFRLSDMGDVPAAKLSYGQQKLLAIARSLAASPKVLLLDEPLAGLSAPEREQVIAVVQRFRRDGTVLIVDHAFGVISRLCDHVIVLNTGTKLTEGPPALIAQDRTVIEVYFG